MSVSYDELLRRLFAARRAGVDWGTARVRAVLDALGAPDRSLGTIVHVGGTNGKGSTSAMIAAIARAAGRRVGMYTSPHLSCLRERALIDGELASEDAWCGAAERVWAAGGSELTFFEQVTAIGVCVLAEAALDVCVLEVGLGGRLDATNAIDAPIAVVTGVAMDHEQYLGDTLRAIAGEKAGIFKRGQRVVIGASGEREAVPWLADAARAAGAESLTIVSDEMIAAVPPVALLGAHQRANAAAAIAAIEMLDPTIGPLLRAKGLASARNPGRLEEVAPGIVLDGAHNPHGARALGAWLADRSERPRVLVVAVSSDKDVAAMLAALTPHVERVIATRYAQPRAMDPAALATLANGAETAPDVMTAIARARHDGAALIIVAGSLFVVGEARAHLIGGPIDPIVVTDPVGPKI
ncbi:MAG TPA: Mur ligase family protein [Kofleriaceae bacterium]|jgi:dihydrofolate synthase/folylpolyglutamate synthase|nr:Mur ligase family protein [Kofleriaceae bacterium]